jgi:hypothetical protein
MLGIAQVKMISWTIVRAHIVYRSSNGKMTPSLLKLWKNWLFFFDKLKKLASLPWKTKTEKRPQNHFLPASASTLLNGLSFWRSILG